MLKRRYPDFSNYSIPGFIAKLYQLGNVAKKARTGAGPSRVMTLRRRGAQGIQTTLQRDFARQYSKKRLPRRVRRRARKMFKRFVKQSLKLVGSNTVIKNNVNSTSTSTLLPQNWTAVHLGGTNGTDFGGGDLNSIISSDTRINGSSGKLLIATANLDVTIRNTSTDTGMECDVYELGYWDNTKRTAFSQIMSDVATDTPAVGTLTSLTINDRGAQLFDFPALSKKGVTIYKKTKVFLPVGNTATYRLKNKKNMWVNATNDIVDNSGYVKKGYTKTLVFVFKPVVGSGDVTTLTVGCTRKYLYKIYEDDADRDGNLP